MGKRGIVCDYSGEELYPGDLIAYAARQGVRVRMADAIVDRVIFPLVEGRTRPMLRVRPTGIESGFAKRKSLRKEWISAEHVRLVVPGERDQ